MRSTLVFGLFLTLFLTILWIRSIKEKEKIAFMIVDPKTNKILSIAYKNQSPPPHTKPARATVVDHKDIIKGCTIEAIVIDIEKASIPSHTSSDAMDSSKPNTTNIILQLHTPQDPIECYGYKKITKLSMHSINNIAPKLSILKKGDVIEGLLGYHRPNPHSKYLRPEFHNGLHIQKVWRDDALFRDWSKEYVYYRHIEVIEGAE